MAASSRNNEIDRAIEICFVSKQRNCCLILFYYCMDYLYNENFLVKSKQQAKNRLQMLSMKLFQFVYNFFDIQKVS